MKSKQLIKMLTDDGWYTVRQKGSHMVMKHDTKKGTLIVPNHGSAEVGTGLEMKLLKQAGIRGS